ncbi:response regulator [Paenibacillus germinis]|nr:response regulator [Paenibacillus germinis]
MIVVDDETWVRQRLLQTIDWGTLGIDFIEEASSGDEALAKAKVSHPDLILTDIRMPNMGGLELMQSLKEHQLLAKVIIISGYSDFEYAKKAVALGAFDYILKPVEDQDLLHIVERCLEQIQLEKKQEALLRKADNQVNKRLPLLKEMLFAKLINGQVQNRQEAVEVLNDFQINRTNVHHICVIFKIQNFEKVTEQNSTDFVQFVIRNVARDFLRDLSENDIVFIHSDEVVVIISSSNEVEVIHNRVLSMSEALNIIIGKILGCSVFIGLGGGYTDIFDISSSYRQAKQSLLFNGYSAKVRKGELISSSKSEHYKNYDIDAIINSIKLGDKESLHVNMEMLVKGDSQITPAELKFIYFQVVHVISKFTVNDEFSEFSLDFFELVHRLQSVQDIRQLLSEAFEKIIDYLKKTHEPKKRKVIEKIIQYVEVHYNETITLNLVAEKFLLNPSYLSKIFKDEVNISFSKFIMEYRIEKAIELMSDPTKKIYEIASSVGYDDVQYFTKIFKTTKGLTPMQYRDKIT